MQRRESSPIKRMRIAGEYSESIAHLQADRPYL